MDNIYKDAKALTNGVIDICLNLAKLDKEGKKESEEYKDLMRLLPKAKELEKRKYAAITPFRKYINANYSAIENARSKERYFLNITKESLSAIRVLNFLDNRKHYALDGIIFIKQNYLQLQEYLEEVFLYEITNYLKNINPKEKDILIDFQYALLATCETIEEPILPKPNWNLNDEEIHASLIYLYPKIQDLTDKLLAMKDSDITSETILWVLYTKACISLLPPLHEGVILEEMRKYIRLKKAKGIISEQRNDKICDMLSYINEEIYFSEINFEHKK